MGSACSISSIPGPYGPEQEKRGPFSEPLFNVLPILADRAALEKPPSYFYLNVKNDAFHAGSTDEADEPFEAGDEKTYRMDMVPLAGSPEGRLRLQVMTKAESLAGEGEPASKTARGRWKVTLNGRELGPATDPVAAYPFPTRDQSRLRTRRSNI